MTFAEHASMKSVYEEAERMGIEYEGSLSLYDRQYAIANIMELLGPFYYWFLPIPRPVRIESEYLNHMVVNKKALKVLKQILSKIQTDSKDR